MLNFTEFDNGDILDFLKHFLPRVIGAVYLNGKLIIIIHYNY